MRFEKTVALKDGRSYVLKNATAADAGEVCRIFRLTHEETDFLPSQSDGDIMEIGMERIYLSSKEESDREIEMCAIVDGRVVGTAGIDAVGRKEKVSHRAEFGISVEKDFCGLGIGRALAEACIECAKNAGYEQLELDVVSDNVAAVSLYKSLGFIEYGRNPKGFRLHKAGWQEIVLMLLPLK